MKTALPIDFSRLTAPFWVMPFTHREMPARLQYHGCLAQENNPTLA